MSGITEERLNALPALRREVTRLKRRLAVLRQRREREGGSAEGDLAYENVRVRLERCLADTLTEEAALLDYINAIENASIRELFMLRYYDGVRPWQKVAFLAGEHDESFVRRRVHAYLKKHTD